MAHYLTPGISHDPAIRKMILKNPLLQPLMPSRYKGFHLCVEFCIQFSYLLQSLVPLKILLEIRLSLQYLNPAPLHINNVKKRLKNTAYTTYTCCEQLLLRNISTPLIPLFTDHPVIFKKCMQVKNLLESCVLFNGSLNVFGIPPPFHLYNLTIHRTHALPSAAHRRLK